MQAVFRTVGEGGGGGGGGGGGDGGGEGGGEGGGGEGGGGGAQEPLRGAWGPVLKTTQRRESGKDCW